jgi:RHH-type proline utilization regulon transcriptional repressor/proline dehydrogenase/delta 1-pyrroline-5-carboxylate dehydrogenase
MSSAPGDIEARLRRAYRADESTVVGELLAECRSLTAAYPAARARGLAMIERARQRQSIIGQLDDVLQEFPLSSDEGQALMALAETLLRIPDTRTVERLIAEKLSQGNWSERAGDSDTFLARVTAQALATAASIARSPAQAPAGDSFRRLLSDAATPIVRHAVQHAVRLVGHKFVFSETIEAALRRAGQGLARGYWYSFDMLGEAARTRTDARRYFESYLGAINAAGAHPHKHGRDALGISVKLSALHPRLEYAKRPQVVRDVAGSLLVLARAARDHGIALTVDAEEADRLELSLEIFQQTWSDSSLRGWDGLGLAVQAYQKRARQVVDWVIALAAGEDRRIPLRLVKGAYWDTEVKRAQERGLDGYPVFTRKSSTDLSYLACVARLLAARPRIYPQFATHNALTIATVLELAGSDRGFEFQRLHGMGEALYEPLVGPDGLTATSVASPAADRGAGEPLHCRVYAPVGTQHDLLAYLVRRLLENGANTSFLNQFADEQVPVERLLRDPVSATARLETRPHPRIPLPRDIFAPERRNSAGIDLSDELALDALQRELDSAATTVWTAVPVIGGRPQGEGSQEVRAPAQPTWVIGRWRPASPTDIAHAAERASQTCNSWDSTPVGARAAALRRVADEIERHRAELMYLAIHEGGKTIPDAVAEVREAADFCRYYAASAEKLFGRDIELPGVTGERNTLSLHGRGMFVCISPWNFPLAIFIGQVAAALAAGNTVLAKPAEQTPLIASLAVSLLQRAGIPGDVVHLLPGDGAVGAALVEHPATAGVVFTGSTDTARLIHRALANRDGPIVPLIAETGGQNAMIVDASALPEQVVDDVVTSAFRSSGQRCSALRVLCVHEAIADRVVAMILGAMEDLELGMPAELSTDLGPLIDQVAQRGLSDYVAAMRKEGVKVHASRRALPQSGHFFRPHLIELKSIRQLRGEVFGPVLHVVRFTDARLRELLSDLAGTGYGLTLGIHSRLEERVNEIGGVLHVGNTYVNRNMIGAVVGSQPFGGEGLSGTGPKAGGPYYLLRFATERTLTVNTAVLGGNASLLSLED